MRATVITDASFCPSTRAGGWAAWVTGDGFERIRHSGPFKNRPKNSALAEVWAAYNGLWLAYTAGARVILIQSDCTAVGIALKHPNGKFGFAKQKLLMPDAVFRYRHVKGHTSINEPRFYVNRWCDINAKTHMKLQRRKTK